MTLYMLMNLGFAGGGGAAATPRRLMTMGIGSVVWWLLVYAQSSLTFMDRNPQWNS